MPAAIVFICLCLTLLAGAQTSYSVRPPRAPEVERILVRTDAAKDSWIGEQDYEAINAWIRRTKPACPGRETSPPASPPSASAN